MAKSKGQIRKYKNVRPETCSDARSEAREPPPQRSPLSLTYHCEPVCRCFCLGGGGLFVGEKTQENRARKKQHTHLLAYIPRSNGSPLQSTTPRSSTSPWLTAAGLRRFAMEAAEAVAGAFPPRLCVAHRLAQRHPQRPCLASASWRFGAQWFGGDGVSHTFLSQRAQFPKPIQTIN